jgi:hypothetical protein
VKLIFSIEKTIIAGVDKAFKNKTEIANIFWEKIL